MLTIGFNAPRVSLELWEWFHIKLLIDVEYTTQLLSQLAWLEAWFKLSFELSIINTIRTLRTYSYSVFADKAKSRSWALTCGNIRVLTSSYYYSFVWRFQKCMNGCCSSKYKKVIRFLIFRKFWFLNFAILKSSSNLEMAVLIKKFLN